MTNFSANSLTAGCVYIFAAITCLSCVILLVRGYLLQPYTFSGKEPFYQTLWLIGGALLAFLASLTLFRSKRKKRTAR